MLGAFFTLVTLKVNLVFSAIGDDVKERATLNRLAEGELHVAVETSTPLVHVGFPGRVISGGNVIKSTSPVSRGILAVMSIV